MPWRISATVTAVVPSSSARRPVTHCRTRASGSGRISSDTTFASRIIISELDCSRRGTSRRQIELNSAEIAEAGHDRLSKVRAFVRLLNRVDEDCADLSLHGAPMPGGPDADQLHDPIIQVPDAHRRHGHHPFLLSMPASESRGPTAELGVDCSPGTEPAGAQPDGREGYSRGGRGRRGAVGLGLLLDPERGRPLLTRRARARAAADGLADAQRGVARSRDGRLAWPGPSSSASPSQERPGTQSSAWRFAR
jgi:hypothetical protein